MNDHIMRGVRVAASNDNNGRANIAHVRGGPAILRGGQGRTARELERDGAVMIALCVGALSGATAMLAIYLFIRWVL